ncbi:MAG: hypothetical protein GKR99_10340 [Rhodobacteraceae bacterium]|nr:hypothetical protein [Paracoccaceae bacterium]
MIAQLVQFESALTEDEVTAVSQERKPAYEAQPGLIQKFYMKLDGENRYGGFMIWESAAALAAFRGSELARTIGTAYRVVGTPDVTISEVMFPLHETADFRVAETVG